MWTGNSTPLQLPLPQRCASQTGLLAGACLEPFQEQGGLKCKIQYHAVQHIATRHAAVVYSKATLLGWYAFPTWHIRLTSHAQLDMPCMQVHASTLLHQHVVSKEVHITGSGAAAEQHEVASCKTPGNAGMLTTHSSLLVMRCRPHAHHMVIVCWLVWGTHGQADLC